MFSMVCLFALNAASKKCVTSGAVNVRYLPLFLGILQEAFDL